MDHADSPVANAVPASHSASFHLFRDSPLAVLIYERESLRFLDVNKAAESLYGYTRNELLTMALSDLHPAADRAALMRAAHRPADTVRATGEWRHSRKDGGLLAIRAIVHDVTHLGKPARLAMLRDYTFHNQIESARQTALIGVRQERERLDNLLAAVPAIVWEFWVEPDETLGRIDYVSRYVETLLGQPVQNWLGNKWHWLTIVHPDDRERAKRAIEAAHVSGEGGVIQFRAIASDNRVIWLESSSVVIRDNTGKPIGMRGVSVDITERKRTEETLRVNEERYRLVEQATNDVIWDWDLVTGALHFNASLEAVFGYNPNETGRDGQWWFDLIHPEDRGRVTTSVWNATNTGDAFWLDEYRFMKADGSWADVRDRGYVMRGEDGTPLRMIGSMRDITEERRIERHLRFLAEASDTLSSSLDYQTTVESLARLPVPFLADFCALDVLQDSGTVCRLAVAHADPVLEAQLEEVVGMRHVLTDRVQPLKDVFFRGRTLFEPHVTDEYLRSTILVESTYEQWRQLKPISHMCVPLYVRGRISGALTLASFESGRIFTEADLTLAAEYARRASSAVENARLHREIQRTDAAKDEFLAMLGHELRNPLGAISNALQLLRLRGIADTSLAGTLEVVERQSRHMTHLVDDLLDVSRITMGRIDLRKETVDVASIINQAVESVQPLLESKRQILSIHIPKMPIWLMADTIRMTQVVSNLLGNAGKFTEPGGHISVVAEHAGDTVVIRVRDTGIGIAPDMLESVFELFSQADCSLDRSQGGLGIGLTVARNLVHLHGGTLSAYSEGIGKGSVFTIRLPGICAGTNPAVTEGDVPAATTPPRPGLRILLVEDNRDAARTMGEILTMMGHTVRIAYDGVKALEMARARDADVIVMDIGLPGMNGYEVASHLCEEGLADGTTLIALTGYGQLEDQQRSKAAGFHYHLVKPVDFERLERLLGELGRSGPGSENDSR